MEENQHKLRIVPHLDSSSPFVFPVMEFTLNGPAAVVHIGRTILADTNKRPQPSSLHMTFNSKVVSRTHAEIFVEQDKVFIRDLESSSGTFLNSTRLCKPNQMSPPFQLYDNDIIQLGVDYQGGTQEIYRSVKIRLELNKNDENMTKFNLQNYNSLRHLTTTSNHVSTLTESMEKIKFDESEDAIHVDECCICLFAIAPFQALFVAPCSHTFHYKCLRPLLMNHPGFACPLCRNYADLDASVSLEVEDVKIMLKTMKQKTCRGE